MIINDEYISSKINHYMICNFFVQIENVIVFKEQTVLRSKESFNRETGNGTERGRKFFITFPHYRGGSADRRGLGMIGKERADDLRETRI